MPRVDYVKEGLNLKIVQFRRAELFASNAKINPFFESVMWSEENPIKTLILAFEVIALFFLF